MARVIAALMRHGVYEQPPGTPSAHLPHPLKPRGIEQARRSARELVDFCEREGFAIDSVIDTSPLLRAWQTAIEVADELGERLGREFRCEEFDALMERGLGAAANLNLEEIRAAVDADPRLDALPKKWKQDSHFKLPLAGAESLIEAGARVRDHVVARCDELANRPQDTLKLFVGHGGSHRHAAVLLGALPLAKAPTTSMHHGSWVLLERDDHDHFELVGGEWKQRTESDDRMQEDPS